MQRCPLTEPIRPPPTILIIHNGVSIEPYVRFLIAAGLEAHEAHAEDAMARVLALQPDVIVLDFDCDGEMMDALQNDPRTRAIPVVALADIPQLKPSDS